MTSGQKIHELRVKKEYSPELLSWIAGVSVETLREWELDHSFPCGTELHLLVMALNVSVDDLIADSEFEVSSSSRSDAVSGSVFNQKAALHDVLAACDETRNADAEVVQDIAAILSGFPESEQRTLLDAFHELVAIAEVPAEQEKKED